MNQSGDKSSRVNSPIGSFSAIDRCSMFFGNLAAWLTLLLVLITFFQVIFRYFFGQSSVAMQELSWHIFGLIFLFAAANTLRIDQHVRVDTIYSTRSEKTRAIIDLFGIIFFILPSCAVIIYYGFRYMLNSFGFDNPNPLDHYTTFVTQSGTLLYSILAQIEGVLRNTILLGEVSSDPGGLEARWIIKGAIVLGFILVLLQSLSLLIHKIKIIFSNRMGKTTS